MTRVPGTLDSAQNDGHQAFQVTTSTWSIDIWSGRKQQITTSKKNNSRNQNLQGSTMGGGQGSTIISRTHSRTLEFTPRGVPILDTSYLRVCFFPIIFYLALNKAATDEFQKNMISGIMVPEKCLFCTKAAQDETPKGLQCW